MCTQCRTQHHCGTQHHCVMWMAKTFCRVQEATTEHCFTSCFPMIYRFLYVCICFLGVCMFCGSSLPWSPECLKNMHYLMFSTQTIHSKLQAYLVFFIINRRFAFVLMLSLTVRSQTAMDVFRNKKTFSPCVCTIISLMRHLPTI